MNIADVDRIVVSLARDYAEQLGKARGTPIQEGTQAQREWLKKIGERASQMGCKVVAIEPSTAVTGPGPQHTGLRRYDALLDVGGCEVWVELQASPYDKSAQFQAQLIGFGEGCAGSVGQALY